MTDEFNEESFIRLCQNVASASYNSNPNNWIITDGENLYLVDWYTFVRYYKCPNDRENIINDIKLRDR